MEALCEGTTGTPLYDRLVVAIPMTNPYGYYNKVRGEKGRDPNRDFPYDNQATACMQTVTGRVLHRIFYHYGHIQTGISFHGGAQSITYPWGCYRHLNAVAPDDKAMAAQALELARLGGKGVYTTGTMNEVVYPVYGGMEDWAYALGPSSEPKVTCAPSSFGGFTDTYSASASLPSASIYLVEISDEKSPSEVGNLSEIWTAKDSLYISPGPRSVRLALATVQLVKPTAQLVPMLVNGTIPISLMGCVSVSVEANLGPCENAPDFDSSVSVSQLCRDGVLFLPIPTLNSVVPSCQLNLDIKFDTDWSNSSSAYLMYTKNRGSQITSPLPLSEGACAILMDAWSVCVSSKTLYVHQGLLFHLPRIQVKRGDIVLHEESVVSKVVSAISINSSIQDGDRIVLISTSQAGVQLSADLKRATVASDPSSARTFSMRLWLSVALVLVTFI